MRNKRSENIIEYPSYRMSTFLSIRKFDGIQYFEFSDSFTSWVEAHSTWEFIYVDKGAILETFGNNKVKLRKGDYIILKPYEQHQLCSADGTSPNVFISGFQCSSPAMNVFRNHYGSLPAETRPIISSIIKETRQTFDCAYNDPHNMELSPKNTEPPGGQQLILVYFLQLLILLYRDIVSYTQKTSFDTTIVELSVKNEIVNDIAKYISAHMYSPITVKDICNEFGYSNSYLSVIFKANTGRSIIEFINDTRIKEAKHLIRTCLYTFTEISSMLCYSDPHYFCRVFRRVTGMSPTEYKTTVLP